MKYVRGWEWEGTWLAWSFLAMILIPLAVAAATVPNLTAVYSATGREPLASTALYEATPILAAAETLGTPSTRSLNAVWPVLLGGGFTVNAAYCAFRLFHRRSAVRLRGATAAKVGLVLAMAVLWSGSNFIYGVGARGMGSLGLVLGWPVFMAAIVLTANAWGLVTGEWRGADGRTAVWAVAGSLLLVAGIAMIALAGKAS